MRATAMLGVIIIHVSSPLVNIIYGKNMSFWWIGNITDSAVRFAVPLFLMISGATLLVKDYSLGDYYKKRFNRVLIPFLFWMIAYWVYRWFMLEPTFQPHGLSPILHWASAIFLREGISKHLWYVYMIVFIYLFVPFLGKGIRKLSSPVILSIISGWVILTFVCKPVIINMYSWSGDYATKFLGFFLYTGYLVVGYYLGDRLMTTRKLRFSAAVIFFLTIVISSVGTYYLSRNAHKLDLSVYGYLTLNTIIQTIAIFMWIKDTTVRNRYFSFILQKISDYSYGIYLVHVMVIGIFFRYDIFWTMAHPLISLPLLTCMITIVSFAIIYLLRLMPGGKYISG